ncbi:MAG: hypothetical protein ACR2PT_11325 [Endozoicomonas sp.]
MSDALMKTLVISAFCLPLIISAQTKDECESKLQDNNLLNSICSHHADWYRLHNSDSIGFTEDRKHHIIRELQSNDLPHIGIVNIEQLKRHLPFNLFSAISHEFHFFDPELWTQSVQLKSYDIADLAPVTALYSIDAGENSIFDPPLGTIDPVTGQKHFSYQEQFVYGYRPEDNDISLVDVRQRVFRYLMAGRQLAKVISFTNNSVIKEISCDFFNETTHQVLLICPYIYKPKSRTHLQNLRIILGRFNLVRSCF